FDELHLRGDERVAVRQALGNQWERHALFPDDFAIAIAFGDAVGVVLSDQNAVSGQNLGVQGQLQAVDLETRLVVGIDFNNSAGVEQDQERVAAQGLDSIQLGEIDFVVL